MYSRTNSEFYPKRSSGKRNSLQTATECYVVLRSTIQPADDSPLQETSENLRYDSSYLPRKSRPTLFLTTSICSSSLPPFSHPISLSSCSLSPSNSYPALQYSLRESRRITCTSTSGTIGICQISNSSLRLPNFSEIDQPSHSTCPWYISQAGYEPTHFSLSLSSASLPSQII